MQCYTELVPPTGVTHSICAAFTGADATNLIVARTSVLQIFNLKSADNNQNTKLVLVAEFSLSGTITALGKVKLVQSDSGGEGLLISFRDAKLSLLEWDPALHSISTISIHYYENHDLLLCPWTPRLSDCVSHLTVDPSSRCAAYNFGINNLAIIPFHQSADDLAMDDFDDLSDHDDMVTDGEKQNGESEHKTPYAPSFVLPLTVLDPGLLHPVDMAFLYEYREPTLGVLYSTAAASINMAIERRDVMIYAVYTLDIEQRASTTLLSIPKLPNDLHKAIPLPLPVGGTLLVGGNELVHIDQGGKITAIGVNEFAKECSSLSMIDRSDLRLRLEGCQLERLGTAGGEMLLVTANGNLGLLRFLRDGRSVSALSLRLLEPHEVNDAILARASTMANAGNGRLFIGSEESDSYLLSTSKPASLRRLNSRGQQNGIDIMVQDENDDDDDDDEMDDNDDDLYADTDLSNAQLDGPLSGGLRVLDRLYNIGPISDVVFGRPPDRKQIDHDTLTPSPEAESRLNLAMVSGKGKASTLSLLQRYLVPDIVSRVRHENVVGAWSMKTRNNSGPMEESFHDAIILSLADDDGSAHSSLFTWQGGKLEPRDGTEFDGNATTIAVGRLSASNHTVQVAANDIRVYDSDFGLSQIFPIVDEDSGEIAQVIAAMVVEPYVAFIKDDRTISILKADKNGELDELELPNNVPTIEVESASLYHDATDFFKTSSYAESSSNDGLIILSVLTRAGDFGIYPLANLQVQIFQHHGLPFLPPVLSSEIPIPKHWKNQDELTEVLLSDIGDSTEQKPFLTIRNTTGDVILYESHAVANVQGAYRFHKIETRNADATDDDDYEPTVSLTTQTNQLLRPMGNVEGYQLVFVTGKNPAVIMRTASSRARIYPFNGSAVKYVSALSDPHNPHGFLFIDSDSFLNTAHLPADVLYGLCSQPIRRVRLDEEITKISYHAPTNTYLVSTAVPTPFQLPQDDEWHPEWTEETTTFLPATTTSSLKLISASTYSVISSYTFDPNEHVLDLKCLPLSVSEETHEIQSLVALGTAITRGENVVTRGNVYVFSIASVNPNPDVPESDLRLKLVVKEDVRGSVSAISSIGSQGFLFVSQGQKAMVRGLKEDKTLLPVAFMDIRFHLSVARELAGTGLTILGDAFSGLSLMGYSEEPYKMQLLARDLENPHVITADFLPDDKSLYIIASNDNGVLRILEYDPENPKTERGTKLLLRSTFNTGSYQTTATLIPRTPSTSEALNMPAPTSQNSDSDSENDKTNNNATHNQQATSYKTNQILLTSQTGSISLLTPLNETTYRRLSTMQNILTTQLEHPAGLNPRAYRNVETDGMGGRGVIDGNVIKRWLGLSSWHKSVMAGKVGGSVWDLRGDVEGTVTMAGLGYL